MVFAAAEMKNRLFRDLAGLQVLDEMRVTWALADIERPRIVPIIELHTFLDLPRHPIEAIPPTALRQAASSFTVDRTAAGLIA